jgi:hypothetical protein
MAENDIIPFNASSSGARPAALGELSPASRARLSAVQLEKDVVDYCERLYEMATQDRSRDREIRETTRAIDYLEGKQWGDRARYGRNRPVLNKVRRHFWDQVGLLTDLTLDYTVKLFDKLNDYSEFERLINVLSVHWAQRNQFTDNIYDIILYGLLHTGPAKVQWNSTLNGGMGDVDIIPIAPWQWATLGAGTRVQDSECVMYFPVVTRDHIARRFGHTLASRVDCDMEYGGALGGGQVQRPSHIGKDTWARMGEGLRTSLGIRQSGYANDALYPMATCKEFWLRDSSVNQGRESVIVGNPDANWSYIVEPGMALYPRGRVIVEAGSAVLEDAPNPYWHAKFPFPVFRPFRVPWKLSGDSMMRSWMQMNTVINTIMGGMLDYLQSMNEPTLVAPKGAFPAGDWDALDPGAPGGKIKYNNNAPKAPEFVKRGEVPVAANMQYIAEVNKEFDMSSGASAMNSALGKKQVPGGDSLEMILNARSLPVKVESRSLASFIEDGGQMVVADMLQFYSVAHRMAIMGAAGITSADYRPIYGEAMPAGMAPEDFVRKFQGIVKRDTLLASQKSDKVQYAFALAKMGKLSDRNLFRALDDNFDFEQNKRELIEEAKVKMQVAAAAAALQGKGPAGHKEGKGRK